MAVELMHMYIIAAVILSPNCQVTMQLQLQKLCISVQYKALVADNKYTHTKT